MMKSKLGLETKDDKDQLLIQALEDILQLTETDMTIFFRNLGNFKKGENKNSLEIIKDAFYIPNDVSGSIAQQWRDWFRSIQF